MRYKIVVDSCCELPEELRSDPHFEIVPLSLEVGDSYRVMDDEHFDQKEFLEQVARSPECPKSACPSPEAYRKACLGDAEHIYMITLSSHLSGSYNSAVLGRELFLEENGEKQIHVVDSESASCGETQIALKLMELEEQGLPFEEIVEEIERFRSDIQTYFVLDNLDTLRKNGRLSAVKAFVASTLSIKPIMAGNHGVIEQKGQCVGMRKALGRMAEEIVRVLPKAPEYVLMISHCNARDRAEQVKKLILEKLQCAKVVILDTRGISSMYANDGGVIVTIASNIRDTAGQTAEALLAQRG